MPTKKAAFKHLRQTKKRTAKNLKEKQALKNFIKQTRKLILNKDKTKASEWLAKTIQALDKAAQHGLIKKNAAARHKSRLTKSFNALK